MSETDVSQVIVINAQKISDLEDRLNAILADIPASSVVGIDYMYEPATYGMVAIVRYLIATD